MTNETDEKLVQRCLEGEIEAYSHLVNRYQHAVYNAALGIVKDPDEAYDCAQTAFIKAYEKLDSFNPKFKFFSWLYRITVNTSLDAVGKRQPSADDSVLEAASTDSPSDAFEQKELQEQIGDALMELTLTYRLTIVLRHFADLTYDEIGYVLDIPVKTVKSRLFEARRALGKVLTKRGVIDHG